MDSLPEGRRRLSVTQLEKINNNEILALIGESLFIKESYQQGNYTLIIEILQKHEKIFSAVFGSERMKSYCKEEGVQSVLAELFFIKAAALYYQKLEADHFDADDFQYIIRDLQTAKALGFRDECSTEQRVREDYREFMIKTHDPRLRVPDTSESQRSATVKQEQSALRLTQIPSDSV